MAAGNYLRLPLEGPAERAIGQLLTFRRRRDDTFNIAGNGIHTLAKYGWTQTGINQFILDVLAGAMENKTRPIARILCGGQTGADIAGAVAGYKLGIPVLVRMPVGFLQRDSRGRDIENTEESIARYVRSAAAALPDPQRV